MAKILLPRYLRAKRRSDGSTGYFWEQPSWSRPPTERFGHKCPVASEALGVDLAAAIGKAELLNAMLDEWRAGVEAKPAEGTVKALFAWYRKHDRYKDLNPRTREEYAAYMGRVESFQLKTTVFGQRRAAEIEASHADAMYRALVKQRGKRAGAYCMQVCRRVWNEAIRSKKVKGPNPFSKMGIKMVAQHGNRATSRAEYDRFRAAAREMGIQSMATAAAISFELLRRVTDVFGYEHKDLDTEERGFFWEGYRLGERFAMRQGKTNDSQVLTLRGDPDPTSDDLEVRELGPLLYPDLEAELAQHAPGLTGHIVINEATGKRYNEGEAIRTFRRIRDKAGLPKEMTFTGFRHGGATELGDAGVFDLRPISGHRTLGQTGTYNKVTESKSRTAGEARRAHITTRAARSQAKK